MTKDQMILALEAAHQVALEAKAEGRHPFGAVLVAPDGETVLMKRGNLGTVRHAETELARDASESYDEAYLWRCSLVTNFEPCAMCTGTIYWANIGHIVFAVTEERLLELTGNHDENPTLSLPCRTVIGAGPKRIQVDGPFIELESTIVQPHLDFWQ